MDSELERSFVEGFRRAGLSLPTERFDLMVRAFAGYRELAAHLEAPMRYDDEPAGLYRPVSGRDTDEAR